MALLRNMMVCYGLLNHAEPWPANPECLTAALLRGGLLFTASKCAYYLHSGSC